MITVPINTVLAYVPQTMRSISDDATILDHAINAYRHFNLPSRWERKVTVLPVNNSLVVLPSDWRRIVRITWWKDKPCFDANQDICAADVVESDDTEPIVTTDTIGPPCSTVYYRLWEDSKLRKHGEELRYMGRATGKFCVDCPTNHTCNSYFSLNGNFNLTVHSHEDGFICFDYFGELYEDGCLLIPNEEPLKQGLAYYAAAMIALDRMWTKEEGMGTMYETMLQKAEILLRKFKGRQLQQNIDISKLKAIDGRNLVYLYFKSSWR